MTADGTARTRLVAALDGAGLHGALLDAVLEALDDLRAEVEEEVALAVERASRGYRHNHVIGEPGELAQAVLDELLGT